jgi:hypothetical protein
MASFRDFCGTWATVTALKANHPTADLEILVIENAGCGETEEFCKRAGVRYLVDDRVTGTAHPRGRLFAEAKSSHVLCVDSHVILKAGVVEKLQEFIAANPESRDLYQGPLVHPEGAISTHQSPVWRDRMLGVWATDPRGMDESAPAFEIPMQGLGLFLCRRDAFPGFNPHFRDFGGEEFYLHYKFKARGDRTWCLPWLRWFHRDRPKGSRPPYPNVTDARIQNYFHGFAELSLPFDGVRAHFGSLGVSDVSLDRMQQIALKANKRS